MFFPTVLTSEIDLSSPLNYGTPGSYSVGESTPAAGATPIRHRPDVRSDRKLRQVAIGGTDAPSVGAVLYSSYVYADAEAVIENFCCY